MTAPRMGLVRGTIERLKNRRQFVRHLRGEKSSGTPTFDVAAETARVQKEQS